MTSILTFKCKPQSITNDGRFVSAEKEVVFGINLPNALQQREGQKVWNGAWSDAVNSKALLRLKLEEFMETQGIWNDNVKAKITQIKEEIISGELKLKAGGFEFDDAVKLALKIKGLRNELRQLLAERNELDSRTAEGQADNERFNYYVSVCLVYNDTQTPVFKSLEEYNNNSATIQARLGAAKLAQLLYGLQENYEDQFAEHEFLKEFGLLDDNGNLVNEDGKRIDLDGRLIDDFGNYILPDNTPCDIYGHPVDDNGQYIVKEKKPFTKNGNIVEPKAKKTE